MLIFLLIFAAAFLLFLFHELWYKRRNLPGGPIPIPLAGNLLSLWNHPRWEDKLLEWKAKFGPIYTYWMGPIPIITVNDYKLAVDMFIKDGDTYVDKYLPTKLTEKLRGGKFGIIDTSGDEWRTQRRFALKVLRDFGLGKNVMQDRILEEVQTICENVNKQLDEIGDSEFEFDKHTNLAAGSLINNVICGYRFSTNGREHEYYHIKELMNRLTTAKPMPLMFLAYLCERYNINIPYLQRCQQQFIDEFGEIFYFVEKSADEHLKNTDYSQLDEPRDFIDAYIMAGLQSEQETGENVNYTRAHLRNTGADLWTAGLETVASTISWSIAYLIVYAEEQQKLHEELDRVIGSDRMIKVADRPNLPYACAIITEVQRCANIIVQNLLRMTTKDVEIDGKLVPKRTVCTAQLSTIMMDPKVFKDPKRFNPQRFIDSNGQFRPDDSVIPFSVGKRACMGESLARMELFLIIVNLFNQYKFTAGIVPPTLQRYKLGVSISTVPYLCRVKRRF